MGGHGHSDENAPNETITDTTSVEPRGSTLGRKERYKAGSRVAFVSQKGRKQMRPFIIAMAFVLFLAACSGGSTIEDSPEASDGELTLSDFIPGAVDFDQANSEQQFLQQERAAQDKIAACMAEQGFEYIPYVPNQDQGGFSMPDTQEEFVEQYGFGIATMILEDQQFDEEDIEAEMARDPNYAITEAMTESEQQEYQAALYGEQPDIDFETMTEEEIQAAFESFEPTGCQNTAYEDMFDQGAAMAFYEQFGPMMEDIYGSVESDPRIVEMEGKWSSCMAESGYEFTDRQDVEVFFLRRLEEVGAITDLEIDSEGMGLSYGSEGIEPGGPIEAAVKEIAAEEIAMAKVSLACSADQEKVFQEVYQEAEQRFIQENLAELEQFKKDNP